MKNRFEQEPLNIWQKIIRALPLGAFIILIICFIGGINSVSETTKSKQLESLETALNRSITQCYAVEGVYPPSLTYLKEHYGLFYDEAAFLVDYQPIGSNLYPDVTVLRKQMNDN